MQADTLSSESPGEAPKSSSRGASNTSLDGPPRCLPWSRCRALITRGRATLGHGQPSPAPWLKLTSPCSHGDAAASTWKVWCRLLLVQALPVLVRPPPPVLVPPPPHKCHQHCQRRAHRLCRHRHITGATATSPGHHREELARRPPALRTGGTQDSEGLLSLFAQAYRQGYRQVRDRLRDIKEKKVKSLSRV